MKAASAGLIALLASRQFYSADLYNFSLIGGGQLNYCGGDQDIVWDSITWSAGGTTGPFFDRKDNKAKCHWKVGVEVDTLVIDVIPGSSLVQGEPFLSALRQGVFDGAEITLYRAFMPTYGNTAAGTVIMFVGRVAEVDAGRSLATFSINSHLELLNQQMPRNLYQAGVREYALRRELLAQLRGLRGERHGSDDEYGIHAACHAIAADRVFQSWTDNVHWRGQRRHFADREFLGRKHHHSHLAFSHRATGRRCLHYLSRMR